jgi:hypothetical protein
MRQGVKRVRTAHTASHTCAAVQPAGRPQLLLVKIELQSWLGKKYCDEAELLPIMLAHGIVRHVRTIEVEVRPLGGDSFKVSLDARRPLVSEGESRNRSLTGDTRDQAGTIQSGDKGRWGCSAGRRCAARVTG